MSSKKILLTLLLLSALIKSQAQSTSHLTTLESGWFVSASLGYQMSGIKDEDFITSNYSPLFNTTVGMWILPYIALQIGYKGFYFNTIADEAKHHYNYFYGEAVINFNELVVPSRINKSWNILLHAGPGYFYNHTYRRPNLCTNIGLQNTYQITNQFQATLDITSIIGWDIYQGNRDILPGVTIGVTYFFNIEGIIE